MIELKLDDNSEATLDTIDFSDWSFVPEIDDHLLRNALEDFIRRSISEAFRNVLTSDPPRIEFQNDRVSVCINFGSSWNDGWLWFIASIEDMVDDYINITHRDTMAGGDDAKRSLAECFTRCAEKLNNAIKE